MKTTNKSKDYHDGANYERKAILRKVRNIKKNAERTIPDYIGWIEEIEEWIEDRDIRYKKRKGGL